MVCAYELKNAGAGYIHSLAGVAGCSTGW